MRFCYISEYQILFNGYGLCQVSRLIYIAAQFNGGVVSKQLHRDNRQRRGEQIRSIRNIEYLIRNAFHIGTAFAHNGNHISAAGLDFLYIADKLFIQRLLGCDSNNQSTFLNQGNGAMLQLAGSISFGMNIGNFLQLQGAFQRSAVVNAATNDDTLLRVFSVPRDW